MTELKVKRLDSPLARRTRPATDENEQKKSDPAAPRRSRPTATRKPAALTSVPEAQDTQRQDDGGPDAAETALGALPDPPALSEPLQLLSTRLPSSLRRSISELTTALRARGDARQSQKALPEQEVLAVLIWLAGNPDDPASIQRLGRALDAYRGRRYAAEARTLGS
jgi:hypothetical protein